MGRSLPCGQRQAAGAEDEIRQRFVAFVPDELPDDQPFGRHERQQSSEKEKNGCSGRRRGLLRGGRPGIQGCRGRERRLRSGRSGPPGSGRIRVRRSGDLRSGSCIAPPVRPGRGKCIRGGGVRSGLHSGSAPPEGQSVGGDSGIAVVGPCRADERDGKFASRLRMFGTQLEAAADVPQVLPGRSDTDAHRRGRVLPAADPCRGGRHFGNSFPREPDAEGGPTSCICAGGRR